MITHRIDDNEVNPKTECGLEVIAYGFNCPPGPALARIDEPPTCEECLALAFDYDGSIASQFRLENLEQFFMEGVDPRTVLE